MKHKNIIIVIALAIIILGAVSISAAHFQKNVDIKKVNNNKTGLFCNFTDENNDGICDNCNNTNLKCDGTKQQIRNHTYAKLNDKNNNQQNANGGVCDSQVGNQYGKQVASNGVSNSNGQSNADYKYSQSSSSQSGSGYHYGQSSSNQGGSTNHHGSSNNGQHSQQKLQIRDC